MNKLFTIGEMAKLFGINAKTLRYYDEIGLIRPEHTDPMTGYRYYSTGQFERLNTIKYLEHWICRWLKLCVFLKIRISVR